MAQVTITNLTSEPQLLQELYTTLPANGSTTIERWRDDLHAMPRLHQLWKDGIVSVSVVSEVSEDDFLEEKVHLYQDDKTAHQSTTRQHHEPTVTPSSSINAPGQQPTIATIGTTIVAEMTVNTDAVYRIFKIPSNYSDTPAFHIHWTKESGASGDSDQSGNAVRWRISYTVFRSAPSGIEDMNVAPTVVEVEDTYDDAGTTTRLAHRTDNVAASGFIAGYYVGICVEAVTPTGSALTCEPALISADLTFNEFINS